MKRVIIHVCEYDNKPSHMTQVLGKVLHIKKICYVLPRIKRPLLHVYIWTRTIEWSHDIEDRSMDKDRPIGSCSDNVALVIHNLHFYNLTRFIV